MPKRFARAPGRRPQRRRQHRGAGCRGRGDDEVGVGERRDGRRAARPGRASPGTASTRSRSRQREGAVGLGLGLGEQRRAGDEHGAAARRRARRSRRTASGCRAGRRGRRTGRRGPAATARSAPPWVWTHALRRAPAARREQDDEVVGRADRARSSAATSSSGGRRLGQLVDRARPRRSDGSVGCRPPGSRVGHERRARPRRGRRGSDGRGTPARRPGAVTPRRRAAGPAARAVAAACSAARARAPIAQHGHRGDGPLDAVGRERARPGRPCRRPAATSRARQRGDSRRRARRR